MIDVARLNIDYRQVDRTKHVHGIHQYKGKFIPQIAEVLLGEFPAGSFVLDPFCGSGTTLVQACEMGINSVGVELSKLGEMISNAKISEYDTYRLICKLDEISRAIASDLIARYESLESAIDDELSIINASSSDKASMVGHAVDRFDSLVFDSGLPVFDGGWVSVPSSVTINNILSLIKTTEDRDVARLLMVMLSRLVRSSRLTPHRDLCELRSKAVSPYYCSKHHKICAPVITARKRWESIVKNTLSAVSKYSKVRSDSKQICVYGDSSNVNLEWALARVGGETFDGIVTSPPYLGIIEYQRQHVHSYEALGIKIDDSSEIGGMSGGVNRRSKEAYIDGISRVLLNCKSYMKPDFTAYLVSNDKYGLYDTIIDRAGMVIKSKCERFVINRNSSWRGKDYSESVFEIKGR